MSDDGLPAATQRVIQVLGDHAMSGGPHACQCGGTVQRSHREHVAERVARAAREDVAETVIPGHTYQRPDCSCGWLYNGDGTTWGEHVMREARAAELQQVAADFLKEGFKSVSREFVHRATVIRAGEQ